MLWISAVIAVGFGIITLVGIMPFLRKRIVEAEAQADARCAAFLGFALHRPSPGRPPWERGRCKLCAAAPCCLRASVLQCCAT